VKGKHFVRKGDIYAAFSGWGRGTSISAAICELGKRESGEVAGLRRGIGKLRKEMRCYGCAGAPRRATRLYRTVLGY
jgi:hypothetical protein